jgi:hypothetical protein
MGKTSELLGNIAEWRSMTFGAVPLNEILSPLRLPFRHLGTYQRHVPDSSFYCPRPREAMKRKREEFCQTRRASDKPPIYKSRHAQRASIAHHRDADASKFARRVECRGPISRSVALFFREEREQLLD